VKIEAKPKITTYHHHEKRYPQPSLLTILKGNPMSNATNSVASKLVAIFGIGASLTAVYKGSKVAYSNGSSRLEVDVVEADKKQDGTYSVTVKSDTEIEEVLVTPPKAEPDAAAKPAVKVGQNPSFGFNQRQAR
jgi:hypothetical protein